MNSNTQVYINNCGSFYYKELANLINKRLPVYRQKQDDGANLIRCLNYLIEYVSKLEKKQKYTNKSYIQSHAQKVKDYFYQEIEGAGDLVGIIFEELNMEGDFLDNQDEIEEIIITKMVDFVYNYYYEYQ